MVTLRKKRQLAALNKENCEEHPRINLSQNSNVPRAQEDCITQVSEEIEGRVTKKLSQEFRRTENRILGAISRLDASSGPLWNHCGDVPERIWHKPGDEWGWLPKWASTWSRCLPEPGHTKLWPRSCSRHQPVLRSKVIHKSNCNFESKPKCSRWRRQRCFAWWPCTRSLVGNWQEKQEESNSC